MCKEEITSSLSFSLLTSLFFPDSAVPGGLSFCTSLSLAAIKPLQAQAQLQIRGDTWGSCRNSEEILDS